jgi:predicted AlkP superfamily phosphohydrolase/phosphomutase
MTQARFALVDHLLFDKEWDFFMMMEIGLDRMHHGFWSYHDPEHRAYRPGTPYEDVIHEYYVRIDRKVGSWLERLGPEVAVMVVSDHGAQPVDGWICVNEWLWREGYLTFLEDPEAGMILPFEKVEVDWTRTRVWGAGGYYGRFFLNVQGREPQGIVPESEYESLRDELSERLAAIPAPDGSPLNTRVFKAEQIYREVKGIPPDLLVYFDNLRWRSAGSLGHGDIYSFENDTGPDDCNHDEYGLISLYDPRRPGAGREVTGAELMDVAPTILELMNLPIPDVMQGRSLIQRGEAA